MKLHLLLFLIITICFSCKSYKENIMFRVEEPVSGSVKVESTGTYLIKPHDILIIDIYTGKGERLIDPDQQLPENRVLQSPEKIHYSVLADGTLDLPMVGKVNLTGLTLEQASDKLEEHYSTFYQDPFVLMSFVNKRVTVLGATGGQGQVFGKVIPLTNEKMTVSEILALSGGLATNGKAGNIRLLRGEQVRILNLSTFEGYLKDNIVVESGDIIYVEPVRRPVSEFLRENYPLIGVTTGIISLISVIISLNN